MSKYLRVQGVRKSKLVPPVVKTEYEKDLDALILEKAIKIEEEINAEISGLRIELDYLRIIAS